MIVMLNNYVYFNPQSIEIRRYEHVYSKEDIDEVYKVYVDERETNLSFEPEEVDKIREALADTLRKSNEPCFIYKSDWLEERSREMKKIREREKA